MVMNPLLEVFILVVYPPYMTTMYFSYHAEPFAWTMARWDQPSPKSCLREPPQPLTPNTHSASSNRRSSPTQFLQFCKFHLNKNQPAKQALFRATAQTPTHSPKIKTGCEFPKADLTAGLVDVAGPVRAGLAASPALPGRDTFPDGGERTLHFNSPMDRISGAASLFLYMGCAAAHVIFHSAFENTPT